MSVINNGTEYRVADAHAHIYPGKIAQKASESIGEFYHLKIENIGFPHLLYETGTSAGIEKFLVSSVATKKEQARSISKFIAGKCKKYKEFVGLGAWHQDLCDIEEEFDYIEALGLRGIKLHPDFQEFNVDDSKMLDVYKEAAARGLPILFHAGDDRTDFSSPTRLAKVADKVPDLICIAAHLGGYRRWSEAARVLRGANVYIDTCSSLYFMEREDAIQSIEHFGVQRTMFGTDFPMWDPTAELERFFALSFSTSDNQKMLYDNFAGLFGE